MNFNEIILLIISSHLIESAKCMNYCSESMSCGNITHTLCLYKNDSLGSQCLRTGVSPIKITPSIIDQILSTHNGLRNRIATNKIIPSACGMSYINWDEKLEFSAKRWGNQCTLSKDPCRKYLTNQYFPTLREQGQNIGEKISSIFPKEFASLIIRDWYMQGVVNKEGDLVKGLFEERMNEFTQLVLQDIKKVGCAAYHTANPRGYRLICNYDKTHKAGEMVYKEGYPCTCCEGTICNHVYVGLCGKNIRGNGFIIQPAFITYFLVLLAVLCR